MFDSRKIAKQALHLAEKTKTGGNKQIRTEKSMRNALRRMSWEVSDKRRWRGG